MGCRHGRQVCINWCPRGDLNAHAGLEPDQSCRRTGQQGPLFAAGGLRPAMKTRLPILLEPDPANRPRPSWGQFCSLDESSERAVMPPCRIVPLLPRPPRSSAGDQVGISSSPGQPPTPSQPKSGQPRRTTVTATVLLLMLAGALVTPRLVAEPPQPRDMEVDNAFRMSSLFTRGSEREARRRSDG